MRRVARIRRGVVITTGLLLLGACTTANPGDARITDLHVWRIGPDAHSAIVSVTGAVDVATVRDRLRPVHELGHLTVECR